MNELITFLKYATLGIIIGLIIAIAIITLLESNRDCDTYVRGRCLHQAS